MSFSNFVGNFIIACGGAGHGSTSKGGQASQHDMEIGSNAKTIGRPQKTYGANNTKMEQNHKRSTSMHSCSSFVK